MAAAEPWTIKRILDWTSGYLGRKGDEHPRLSAEWLLANVCGLSRVELYVNFDKPLEADELAAMHAAIERREIPKTTRIASELIERASSAPPTRGVDPR